MVRTFETSQESTAFGVPKTYRFNHVVGIDLLEAKDPESFYAATRALDRVLLWNFYWIPGLAMPGYRLVYWNRFGQPDHDMSLQRSSWVDTWWWDPVKAERVIQGKKELASGD